MSPLTPTPGKREKNAWYHQVRVEIWAPHMASAVVEMGWGEMKVHLIGTKFLASHLSSLALPQQVSWGALLQCGKGKKFRISTQTLLMWVGPQFFSVVFGWSTADCLEVFCLGRWSFWMESKLFSGLFFWWGDHLYLFAFPGCWFLQCPVWDIWRKKETRELTIVFSWVLRSLAHLPSFYLFESCRVCFIYNV